MDNTADNRQIVLEIVLYGLHIPPEVYKLRYDLFLKAAKFHFRCSTPSEVLEPFPNCFYDTETKTRRYDELKECVENISKSNIIYSLTDTTQLPEQTWALLCWIFTNPLNIEVVKESETSVYLSDVLREKTKLLSIPNPSCSCTRFDITHTDEIRKKIFLAHKAEYGSFFAYHGSPGQNFHSIMHRGLRSSLNVRSSYGSGTYLTSNLNTASRYSHQKQGRMSYCVAIVEVIKHPSITVVTRDKTSEDSLSSPSTESVSINSSCKQYYVVDSDELMRLRHLLVFY
ncbi:hypothetical protein HA402_008342 [Bradysia odoriphaga]|nr:hypothetical protein HA402_008342 [Bradysia odoriphaga]